MTAQFGRVDVRIDTLRGHDSTGLHADKIGDPDVVFYGLFQSIGFVSMFSRMLQSAVHNRGGRHVSCYTYDVVGTEIWDFTMILARSLRTRYGELNDDAGGDESSSARSSSKRRTRAATNANLSVIENDVATVAPPVFRW